MSAGRKGRGSGPAPGVSARPALPAPADGDRREQAFLRDAARAVAAFLLGFLGMPAGPAGACVHGRGVSAADARAALADRAARRPSCC